MTPEKEKKSRKHPRCDMNKWVVCNFGGESEISIASIKNLSGGGICILTEKEPRKGETISMELAVPGEFLPAALEGEVRWVEKLKNPEGKFQYSSGILFSGLLEKDKLNIINMVREHLKRSVGAEKTGGAKKERNKMLVIDGDEIVIGAMKDIFGAKFNLFSARNAEIGFAMAERNRPDIILQDVEMKMEDKTLLFEKLKSDPGTYEIRLILISRFGRTDLVESALKAGADDFLMTPHSIRKIMDMSAG